MDPSDADFPKDEAAARSIATLDLAEMLIGRLCHDLMSPASGIASGLDFLADEGAADMREEAMGLIASSARKLMDLLGFYRVALGGHAEDGTVDSATLESLARGLFAHVRPELEWPADLAPLDGRAARVLLNLVHISAGAVALGGIARVSVRREIGWTALIVEADGPRARLQPEIAAGLKGLPLEEGLAGRWIQAFWLQRRLTEAGGAIEAETSEAGILFKAILPA